jgi:hypothetical protein
LVDIKEKEINSEKIDCEFELDDGPDISIIEFVLGANPIGIIEGSTE